MRMSILFALCAILCWGAYVPTIHHAQLSFDGRNKSLWAFLFVGVAYFLVAVLIPAGYLGVNKEPSQLSNGTGVTTGIIAGTLGALGALFVIFALRQPGAKPIYVAPLVFAGAPIVNTFVSVVWKKLSHPDQPVGQISPLFILGILLAAGGAALVLVYKPSS